MTTIQESDPAVFGGMTEAQLDTDRDAVLRAADTAFFTRELIALGQLHGLTREVADRLADRLTQRASRRGEIEGAGLAHGQWCPVPACKEHAK